MQIEDLRPLGERRRVGARVVVGGLRLGERRSGEPEDGGTGPRHLVARFLNLNFDVTTPAATYSGVAVVDYVFQFAPNLRTFAASCQGKIFPPGADPFDPASIPVTTFDCAYLDGFLYRRMPLP